MRSRRFWIAVCLLAIIAAAAGWRTAVVHQERMDFMAASAVRGHPPPRMGYAMAMKCREMGGKLSGGMASSFCAVPAWNAGWPCIDSAMCAGVCTAPEWRCSSHITGFGCYREIRWGVAPERATCVD